MDIAEDRIWGQFTSLFHDDVVKVKELVIDSKQGISYQRHFNRSEIWFISKGKCRIKHALDTTKPDEFSMYDMKPNTVFQVQQGTWHQVFNPYDEACHIIEIQYGEETSEDDIERLEYYGEQNETATS